jgi:predicted Rossmann-fold nucleotide-binding protein
MKLPLLFVLALFLISGCEKSTDSHVIKLKNTQENYLQEDFLQALKLRKLDPAKTVSVVLGNSLNCFLDKNSVTKIISEIRDLGYTVIYDADSSTALTIAEAAGVFGIGISGSINKKSANPEHKVVVIENTSLRMDAFLFRYRDEYQKGHRLVVSLDSTAGVGLILQIHPNAFVFDQANLWQNQSHKWVELLGERAKTLGLTLPPLSLSIDENTAVETMNLGRVEQDSMLKDIVLDNSKIESMDKSEIDMAVRYSEEIMQGKAKGIDQLRGVVVFCSAVGDPATDRVISKIAYDLAKAREPVVTGGSIAVMQIVNQAAKDAQGISVGLPIRRPLGHREYVTPIEAHTLTHSVEAHPARLYFLLENRDAILISPGGRGVMKEIGATFIKFAAEENQVNRRMPKVIFIDRYYQGLYDFISYLPLPDFIRSQFKLLPIEEANKETILELMRKNI